MYFTMYNVLVTLVKIGTISNSDVFEKFVLRCFKINYFLLMFFNITIKFLN